MSCSQVSQCLSDMTGARPPAADCKPSVTLKVSLPKDIAGGILYGTSCCLVLHVSLTPHGMNGAEFDVFAIKRNIERCRVGLVKFTKSSGYASTDRACGLYCLPDSQNKILYALQCVGLSNALFWGCFVFTEIIG